MSTLKILMLSKFNGELLEVSARASVCLASMNKVDGICVGVLLPKCLACMHYFMQDQHLSFVDIWYYPRRKRFVRF